MRYRQDVGPLDALGKNICEGDLLVVGTNSGIRVGNVIAVKTFQSGHGSFVEFSYTVTIEKYFGNSRTKRQTFSHEVLGEDKFWIVDLDIDGKPRIPQ